MGVCVMRYLFCLCGFSLLLCTASFGYAKKPHLSPWIYQKHTPQLKTITEEKTNPTCQTGSWRYHTQKDIWQYCNHKGIWTLWALPQPTPKK